MARAPATLLLLALAACGKDELPADPDTIRLDWAVGDTFHLATSYRVADVAAEEAPVDLESGEPASGVIFGEMWSPEVVWTYQVVESGYVPDDRDELYPYALTATGELASLAVIRVTADPALNEDEALLAADPVTYLVFREDRDRLAGVISFVNLGGERVERAWSSRQLGRSWSVLSQSSLSMVPTYLAPYSATWSDGERRLEDGSLVTSVPTGRGATDVYYDDELDGGLVVSRYEPGAPWPTWTVAQNVVARLMDEGEVAELAARSAPMMPVPPEDLDYREALASAVDIDAAMSLDEAVLADGGFSAFTPPEHTPWAGSWWPLKYGDLVFGYSGRATFSDEIKDRVDEIKTDMDRLSSEIRDMEAGEDKDAKIAEWRELQSDLIDLLVEFYGGLLADLDGGRARIEDGRLVHDDGWSYDLDELSPMDKLALAEYLEGRTSPNPFYLPAWEILNSYNPGGESWWGHCNGWSAAAILTNEPRTTETVRAGDLELAFTTADLKGLFTEAHYSSYSHFYGERYNGEDDDITDLSPAAFQRLLGFYVRELGVPLVFDTTADEAVWNYPAYGVDLAIEETTPAEVADLVNINTASLDELDALPGIGETLAARIIEYRETYGPFQSTEELMEVEGIGEGRYGDIEDLVTVDPIRRTFDVVAEVSFVTDAVDEDWVDFASGPEDFTETWSYTLVTDEAGTVIDGTWDEEDDHPDFAWVPYGNQMTPSSSGS